MADHAPCPRCRHTNPPENRFCGSCGTPLGARTDLVARREGNPTVMGHAVPVKPGPVGKALAVGLVTLAVRAGLSWLRNRTSAENQSSALSAREPDTAVSERLLSQRLEEVLIQELKGERPGRFLAWRAVRSIVITGPTDRRI
jgi:Double zinc ribbon